MCPSQCMTLYSMQYIVDNAVMTSDKINFDSVAKVIFARILPCRLTIFSFVIMKYLGKRM